MKYTVLYFDGMQIRVVRVDAIHVQSAASKFEKNPENFVEAVIEGEPTVHWKSWEGPFEVLKEGEKK